MQAEKGQIAYRLEIGQAPNKKKHVWKNMRLNWDEKESSWPTKAPRRRSLRWHFNSYAPLSASRTQILMEFEGKEYLHRPPPMKTPSIWWSKWKYYHFYHDHGHDIEEYLQLKDEIEVLIRRDYLGKYVRKQQNQTLEKLSWHQSDQENNNNRPMISVINCWIAVGISCMHF